VILLWKGKDGGRGRCTLSACNADHNGREISGMYRPLPQWNIVGWNPCRNTDVCAFSVFLLSCVCRNGFHVQGVLSNAYKDL